MAEVNFDYPAVVRDPRCRCLEPDDLCQLCEEDVRASQELAEYKAKRSDPIAYPTVRCESCMDRMGPSACSSCMVIEQEEHDEDHHFQRAEDGEAAPVIGCGPCEEAFPEYFREMREARREYDRRPYHDEADHERGHPERPEIAMRERVLGEDA